MRIESIHKDELPLKARQLCSDPAFVGAVARHIVGAHATSVDLRVHSDDQMLNYSVFHLGSASAALSQYYGVALQQHAVAEQILSALLPDRSGVRVLDFACGFGRMLRFLTGSIPANQISGSDIQRDAVDFVSSRFGVRGIYSSAAPGEFDTQERFDFIWVASLFSHLPKRLFEAWLQTLSSCLTPNGVLCFSVHDASLLAPSRRMPEDGLLFKTHSENDDLERAEYGTTHVTETYTRGAIERAFGDAHQYRRKPRALAYQQDLYIVAKDRTRDLSALDTFRWGPWGWVDVRKARTDGSVRLSGWAASFDNGGIDRVEVAQEGRTLRCDVKIDRPDVEAVYADERMRRVGWEIDVPVSGTGVPSPFTEISAVAMNGARALLYAGPLVDPGIAWRWGGLELLPHMATRLIHRVRTML